MQITKRLWNLNKAQRLLILVCTGLYLLAFHPWSHTAANGTASVYAGATAMLVLASLPSKVRLLSALAFAVVTAFIVLIGLQAGGGWADYSPKRAVETGYGILIFLAAAVARSNVRAQTCKQLNRGFSYFSSCYFVWRSFGSAS